MGYGITIRASGPYALFTRPEMKAERVSYDMITPSAARGLIEAIYWKPAIRWEIDRIHVLNQIAFTNIRRNEVSDIVPSTVRQYMKGSRTDAFYLDVTDKRQQRASLILKDVDYVIEAHFEMTDEAGPEETEAKHYNIALRRLRRGQHYHAPYLGTREFGAKVTLIEDAPIPPSTLTGSRDLGYMLYDLDFSDPEDIKPIFFRAVLEDGVLDVRAARSGMMVR